MASEARFSIGVTWIAVCVTLCSTYEIQCHPDVSLSPQPYLDINDVGYCSAGTYNEGLGCALCAFGSFRTERMARANKYSPCQKCTEPAEKAYPVEPCNATTDTKIKCEAGHFRYNSSDNPCTFECKGCAVCGTGSFMYKNYETKSCSDDSDTICCEKEGMDVVEGNCVAKVQPPEPDTATTHSMTKTTAKLSTFTNISTKATAMSNEGSSTKSDARILFQKPYLLSLTIIYFVTADYITNFNVHFI